MISKVFGSCAVGAFIGSIVALQLDQHIWWLGMLVGALIGYLGYDLRGAALAFPRAWQKTTSADARMRWRIFGQAWWAIFNFQSAVVFGLLLLAAATYPLNKMAAIVVGMFAASSFFCLLFLPVALAAGAATTRNIENAEDYTHLGQITIWSVYFHPGPLITLWTVMRGGAMLPDIMALGARWLMAALRTSALRCRQFGWHLFTEIHSDFRLLCGCDAAFGTVIGYLLGHALIGAAAGGLIGVLNFEFISRRWLHLVP